jgi:hypothetical protein
MGTHHISIRDGETIQVAMLSDGQITIAADQGQPMTLAESEANAIRSSIASQVAEYPLTTAEARSPSSHLQVSIQKSHFHKN